MLCPAHTIHLSSDVQPANAADTQKLTDYLSSYLGSLFVAFGALPSGGDYLCPVPGERYFIQSRSFNGQQLTFTIRGASLH